MISSLILIIQVLCLSLWVGGSAVHLLVITPTLLRDLPREQAVPMAGSILRRFGAVLLPALFVLAGTILIQVGALSGTTGLKLRFALILVFGGMLVSVYDRYLLLPRMLSGDEQEFRKLHRRSLSLVVMNLFLGIAVVITFIIPISF